MGAERLGRMDGMKLRDFLLKHEKKITENMDKPETDKDLWGTLKGTFFAMVARWPRKE